MGYHSRGNGWHTRQWQQTASWSRGNAAAGLGFHEEEADGQTASPHRSEEDHWSMRDDQLIAQVEQPAQVHQTLHLGLHVQNLLDFIRNQLNFLWKKNSSWTFIAGIQCF